MKILKDSLVIIKILINEIFHNLFSHSLFSKKQNKYIFAVIFITLYILYYSINIFSISNISIQESQLTNELRNITITSLFNYVMIITGSVYLLVEISFTLTNKMKYQIKMLPFEKQSFLLAVKIFKNILGFLIFSVIFMVIIPVLNLLYLPINLKILIIILCNILSLAAFQLYYLIFSYLLVKVKFIKKYKLNIVSLIIILFYYFFKYRFIIDSWVAKSSINFTQSFVIMLIISITIIYVSLIAIDYFLDEENEITYINSDFITIFKFKNINIFKFYLLGFIRSKFTISLLGVSLLFFILCFYDTRNILISIETAMYVYPSVAVSGIRYYDTSLKYRKMNNFFNISEVKEVIIITIINLIINLPLIFITFLSLDYLSMALNSIIWFECAIISGILFPKNKSSLNEFSSTILCLVLMALTYLVSKNISFFIITFTGMIWLKKYLLERGRLYEIF